MFNECLIHLLDCTCLNVMCVCSIIYGLIQKDFWSFYMFLEWFLSLFVFMFSAYFVFHCLNMFCFWKTSVKIFGYSFWLLAWAASFGYSFWRLASRESKPWVHTEGFRDSLITRQSQNAHNQLFKELFSWETCFKPLSSSLKPLFQYFYIKTQPIWIFFLIPLTSLR